ncbi:MAG: DUF349 domain-containing protein [Bacteroidota bacterium]
MERQNENLGANEENETSLPSDELSNVEKIVDDTIDNSSVEFTTTLEDEIPTDTIESPINSVEETVAVQENNFRTDEDTVQDIVESIEAEDVLVEASLPMESIIDLDSIPELPEIEEHLEEKSEDVSEEVSFEHLKRPELVHKLEEISRGEDLISIKKEIKALRDAFVAISKDEFNALRDAFNLKRAEQAEVETDTEPEPFVAPEDPLRERYRNVVEKINAKIQQQIKDKEKQLIKNLNEKREIIDAIKNIVDNPAFNFKELEKIHELQTKWRNIGFVPTGDSNNIWESYKFHTGRFYDRLARDKELKELDHRKNLHEKKLLCEKAEELIVEPSLKIAIDKVKALQKHWKEVGGVSREDNELIWERFNSAVDKVYTRQREYVDKLREQQKANFDQKSELLALMTDLASKTATNHKEWQELTEKSDAIMNTWKQVGFASKEQNETIWKNFKEQRDIFYKAKEEFYDGLRQMLTHNLKLKQDMIEQVEALANSTDWRNTTNTIKNIQEQWKTVGAVSKKHSEKVWARFRKACDTFFENKKLNFADEEIQQQKNLEAKNELITKIENFQLLENNNETIQELKKFQSEWMGIGHIPFKVKEDVNSRYKKAIDKQFELVRAKVGDNHKSLFQMKYQELGNSPKGADKIKEEKQKLRDRITKINIEIAQFENNIGFFAKSSGADAILKDVRAKIENSKREIERIKEQLKMLDEIGKPAALPKEDSLVQSAETGNQE